MRYTVAIALALVGGCANPPSNRLDEEVIHPEQPPIAPHDECTVVTYRVPAISAQHQEPCSELPIEEYPPAGGPHFSRWASFGIYDAPVPWGFLMHSMEHGAVVLAHNCDGACPDVVSSLEARANEQEDLLCRDQSANSRMIVAPEPALEWPIAAVAWEHVYLATCLDPASLDRFIGQHYGNAPEDLCIDGVDRSADGWCP